MRRIKDGSFYLVRKLWYSLALLLVLAAVVVSVARVMLPRLDQHREAILDQLRERFQVELAVDTIEARWTLTGPELVLKDVLIRDESSAVGHVQLRQLSLDVAVWGSLLALEPKIRSLELEGLKLELTTGNGAEGGFTFEQVGVTLAQLLNTFDHVELRDAELMWSMGQDQPLQLSLPVFSWGRLDERYQGAGLVTMDDDSEPLQIQAWFQGEQVWDIRGQVFLDAPDLELTRLLHQLQPDAGWQQTVFRGRSWLEWDRGQLQKVQLELEDAELAWQQTQLTALSGQLRWLNQPDGWQVETVGLSLLPDLILDMRLQQSRTGWQGYLSQLPLTEISALLVAQPLLPEPITSALKQLQLQGQVNQLFFHWDRRKQQLLGLQAQVDELGWQRWQQLPGLTHLSGEIGWWGEQARARLRLAQTALDLGDLFPTPIPVDQLEADLQLVRQASGWYLGSPRLQLSNPDMALASVVELFLPDGGAPELRLYGEARDIEASHTSRYFPEKIMAPTLVDYLAGSLKGGTIDQARILFHGPLTSFPFNDHSGIFQVFAGLRDGHFDFDPLGSPSWLDLQPLQLDVRFENASLVMTSRDAWMGGSHIHRLRAEIPKLAKGARLAVDVSLDTDGAELAANINSSPLRNSLGKVLNTIQVSGPLDGRLNLDIPLTKGKKATVRGKVNLQDNQVDMPTLGLALDGARGSLSFVNGQVTTDKIQASLLGQPVTLAFDGRPVAPGRYDTNINLLATWQTAPLQEKLGHPLLERVEGQFNWNGSVAITSQGGDHNYQISLNSNLQGLETDLPIPRNKQSHERWPLSVQARGDLNSGVISFDMGRRIRGRALLARKQGRLLIDRVGFALGQEAQLRVPKQPDSMGIVANYDKAQLQPWLELVSAIIPGRDSAGAPNAGRARQSTRRGFFPPLIAFQAEIDELTLSDGIRMTRARLAGAPEGDLWLLRLRADQTSTRLRIAQRGGRPELDIDSDFILLPQLVGKPGGQKKASPSAVASEPAPPLHPSALPALRFRCRDCQIGELELGRIDFRITPADDLTTLDINIDAGSTRLQAQARWQMTPSGPRSRWQGQFYTRKLERFLAGFGMESSIKDSDADVTFDVWWQGAPWQFEVASLDGSLRWKLGEGLITDVSDKGARVFSLLSLDSLRRKLALDFRDVFSKGLFYNSMEGNVQLDKGVAYSTETYMDGMAGDLDLRGWTNLNNRTLDYDLVFTPKLTSSLPVITAWAIAPVTGVVVYALSKAFEPVVKVITKLRFEVSGTLDDPIIDEVGRSSGEVPLPKPE